MKRSIWENFIFLFPKEIKTQPVFYFKLILYYMGVVPTLFSLVRSNSFNPENVSFLLNFPSSDVNATLREVSDIIFSDI